MLCIQALTRMTFGLMLGKDIACKPTQPAGQSHWPQQWSVNVSTA